jgi:hypothetical protein
MTEWQDISTAPRDGSWFMICRMDEGFESYEIGSYAPYYWRKYVPVGAGLFREELVPTYDWRGFNNFHRATHWMRVPEPPQAQRPSEERSDEALLSNGQQPDTQIIAQRPEDAA